LGLSVNNLESSISGDFSKNIRLKGLSATRSSFINLDLTKNIDLTNVSVELGGLHNVDLKNRNNQKIIKAEFLHNLGLECVQVDDVYYANSQPNWTLDSGIFSEDCSGYWGASSTAKLYQIKVVNELIEEEVKRTERFFLFKIFYF